MNPLISHHATDTAPFLLCRAAFDAPTVVAGEVMYMPAGVQTITPSQAGRSVRVKVQVDRAAAAALEKQRAALEVKGKRAYFDFNHEDGEASFWPEEFYWRDGDGGKRVVASVLPGATSALPLLCPPGFMREASGVISGARPSRVSATGSFRRSSMSTMCGRIRRASRPARMRGLTWADS